jgi:hypothetical protein
MGFTDEAGIEGNERQALDVSISIVMPARKASKSRSRVQRICMLERDTVRL